MRNPKLLSNLRRKDKIYIWDNRRDLHRACTSVPACSQQSLDLHQNLANANHVLCRRPWWRAPATQQKPLLLCKSVWERIVSTLHVLTVRIVSWQGCMKGHLYIGTLQFLSRGFCISKLYGCSFAMIVVDVSLASFVFSFASVPQGLWCIAHDIYFWLRPLPSVLSIAHGPLKCKHGFWSNSSTSWLPK